MGWEDIATKERTETKKTKYMELKDGNTYQIRTLDEAPYSRYTHWVPQANNGKGTTIDCIGRDCPICEDIKARKASGLPQRYNVRKLHAMNILDRATNEVVILDKGKRCYEALAGIREMVGDLRGYDIKIRVQGTGTETNYVPVPMPGKPLTEAEKALELYDFNTIYQKLTREQVLMLMDGKSFADIFGDGDNNDESSEASIELEDDEDFLPLPEIDFAN
jgi:hypothetical protein